MTDTPIDDRATLSAATIAKRAQDGANLVRIEPHKHWWRVTRVYVTPEERATAAEHAAAGDGRIGYAYGGGTLVGRGWAKWDGREQLEVGDEVYGIEKLNNPTAFLGA